MIVTKCWLSRHPVKSMEFKAFKSQIFPFKDKLYRFALRMVKSEDEANDIVQETMIRVWNNFEKIKNIANPEAWCMTVTKNLALDTLRARKRWNLQSNEEEMLLTDVLPTPAAATEMTDTLSQIHEIISGLPTKQKQVMHLRDMEGYSYEEICEILEINLNQVKVSLHRARRSVREQLIKVEEYGL